MKLEKVGQAFLVLALSSTASLAMAQADKALAGLDGNGDGVVSRQEALAAQKSAFEHIDDDGDGVVSRTEYENSDPQQGKRGAHTQAGRKRAADRAAWFKNLDADDSGDVTLAEFQKSMTPYFDRLDADGDGTIDRAELKKASQPSRPGRPQK